jgi:DNA-binding transcriptional LysR family regulator
MEPTPKALQLQAPVRAILEQMRSLRSEHVSFDPRISHRTFNFCVVDAGLIKLLPPLVDRLMAEAPNVRLRVLQLEAAHLEPWLESGKLDFAMGSFPSLSKGIRRRPLWTERYVSVVRRGHPRISSDPTLRAFAAEKHVLVSIAGSGHAHQIMERELEAAIPRENIICHIPMFIGAVVLAKHTDAVATLPLSIATVLAEDLDLQIIRPPIKLPKIDIFQYWHDRLHRDPGNLNLQGNCFANPLRRREQARCASGGALTAQEFNKVKEALRLWLRGRPYIDIERALGATAQEIKCCPACPRSDSQAYQSPIIPSE